MGVTDRLARYALGHAHVLVVELPGRWLTRVAVEQHILSRGWRLASSPGDADVLAVCGTPGPQMTAVVARLWDQLPGPRSRVQVDAPNLAAAAFSSAEAQLLDPGWQHDDSRRRPDVAGGEPDHDIQPGMDHDGRGRMNHGDHDMHGGHGGMGDGGQGGHAQPGGSDHGEDAGPDGHHGQGGNGGHAGHTGHATGHSGHGAHAGHGGMEMAPAGIPLARGGEDRDGLEMDVLHVRMGPVLPYWPAGLVLRCALQGDLIVDADASLVDADDADDRNDVRYDGPLHRAARRCDNAAGLLALAGWDDAAGHARRVRDLLLTGGQPGRAVEDLDRLHRRVMRSWLLRWSLRRIGLLSPADVVRLGLPDHVGGDARDRLLSMIERAGRDVTASTGGSAALSEPRPISVGQVGQLVRGLDIAAARLVVASLDLGPLAAVGQGADA